ncbi:hypothetical protein [Polynucleobacter yangtzensis]|nr:hypothetical protein [Polynucleobacter yangtzensis]
MSLGIHFTAIRFAVLLILWRLRSPEPVFKTLVNLMSTEHPVFLWITL